MKNVDQELWGVLLLFVDFLQLCFGSIQTLRCPTYLDNKSTSEGLLIYTVFPAMPGVTRTHKSQAFDHKDVTIFITKIQV